MDDHDELQRYLEFHRITHFTAHEICHRGVPDRAVWPNIIPTLRYAEVLRREFGRCTVTSGYRDREHNAEVGGAPRSLHLSFNALDIKFERGAPENWAWVALEDLGLDVFGGVGEYDTFVHIDTRYLIFGRLPWRTL